MQQHRIRGPIQTTPHDAFDDARTPRAAVAEQPQLRQGVDAGRVLNGACGVGRLDRLRPAHGPCVAPPFPGASAASGLMRAGIDSPCGRMQTLSFDETPLDVVAAGEVPDDGDALRPNCGKAAHRRGRVSGFDWRPRQAELARLLDTVSCRRFRVVNRVAARTPLHLGTAVVLGLRGWLGEPIGRPGLQFAARWHGGP